MLTEQEFREELHRRVGAGLEDVHAPGIYVDRVRARQARRTALVRGSAAATTVAAVACVLVASAVWPRAASRLPAPPGPAASGSHVSPSAVPAPNASTPVIDMSGVAPLVTSGPCAGLAVAVYRDAAVQHPPVTPLTHAGLVLRVEGGGGLTFKVGGPCVDRLSFIQRSGGFDNQVNEPYSFPENQGAVFTQRSAQNQTGVVQFFLDCKGLVCSKSGAPLATVTLHIPGTSPNAAAAGFEPVPTAIPLPSGDVVTIPSVIGMSPQQAMNALMAAGLSGGGSNAMGDTGKVTSQDPPAGSVVPRGSGDSVFVTGADPFTPPPGPPATAVPASVAAQPSQPAAPNALLPLIHWPQRGELVNSRAALDAEAAWDAAKNPHHDIRIVYAGTINGMQGVVLEADGRMGLLVRPTADAPFTLLDDRFVLSGGGLREVSALGRPLLNGGKPASYQVALAVVHQGDVVSVRSPGLQQIGARTYATIVRLPLSATRGNTTLDVTGGSKTVNVRIDPRSSS